MRGTPPSCARARLAAVALILAAGIATPAMAGACKGALPHKGQTFAGRAQLVHDGDTLCIGPGADPLTWVPVRVADFYAPELSEPGGRVATLALRAIVAPVGDVHGRETQLQPHCRPLHGARPGPGRPDARGWGSRGREGVAMSDALKDMPAMLQCDGKERYATPQLAAKVRDRRAASKHRRHKAKARTLEVYRCKHCGFHHIGGASRG